VCTNIAETSVTVDGVRYVVDPGFVKQRIYRCVAVVHGRVCLLPARWITRWLRSRCHRRRCTCLGSKCTGSTTGSTHHVIVFVSATMSPSLVFLRPGRTEAWTLWWWCLFRRQQPSSAPVEPAAQAVVRCSCLTPALTHSITHPLTHSLTHSLNRSHSVTQSASHSVTHDLTRLPAQSLTYSLPPSPTVFRAPARSLAGSPIHSSSSAAHARAIFFLRAGKCYRIYPKETYISFAVDTLPEIQRCNLATTVLELKMLNVDDVLGFDFLDPPLPEATFDALRLLHQVRRLQPVGATQCERLPVRSCPAVACRMQAGRQMHRPRYD
jgi:hypothetical protein